MKNEKNITLGAAENLVDTLKNDTYLRERYAPALGDAFYVPLVDLVSYLEPNLKEPCQSALDFGCGGSPYRSLVHAETYYRADLEGTESIDHVIKDDTLPTVASNSISLVLSTQVLEHVTSPDCYLSEAYRILEPGGRLVLTTHGIWEDHGCPYDFWRWTMEGLKKDIKLAGFEFESGAKITCGPRAIAYLSLRQLSENPLSRRDGPGFLLWLLRKTYFKSFHTRNLWINKHFSSFAVKEAHDCVGIYLMTGVVCKKPESKCL